MSKQIKLFIISAWEPSVLLATSILLFGIMLFYRLGSLVPGYSSAEATNLSADHSISAIIYNPINLLYKLFVLPISSIYPHNIAALRVVSVIFAILAIYSFYYIVSRWHSRNIAIIATALFASSTWFLHYARLAVPDISLTLLLAALAYGTWIRRSQRSTLVAVSGAAIAATLMYVPGLIWFVIIGIIWQRRSVTEHIKQARSAFIIALMLGLLMLVPLIVAMAKQPALLKKLIGIPPEFSSIYDIFRHTINVPFQIFFRGPDNPTTWLGRLPMLDVFSSIMFLAGIYSYFQRRSLDRTKLLFGALAIGTVLSGLRGPVPIILLLPIIYLIISAGLAYMIDQWFIVFPRNPLARLAGVLLIVIAVLMSSSYNLRRYFIAWPNAPATKREFSRHIQQ